MISINIREIEKLFEDHLKEEHEVTMGILKKKETLLRSSLAGTLLICISKKKKEYFRSC